MSASTLPASAAVGGARASSGPTPVVADKAVLEVKHRLILMWAVFCVSICQFIDATIGNVALPFMRNSLGASAETISWTLTSFITAGAIAMPITGWLSDRIGSRNLFMLSTALFLGASALCGAATSLPQMVAFRALQGVGAAFIGPLSQTIMFDINPPSKQTSAMSLWGMVVMIAPISGPFLGGFLTEYLNWRWVYYVNLPIGIPALAVIWWLLPSRPLALRRLDGFGFATIALGLGALQLLLDRGQGQDWLESPEIVIELIVAISATWIFVIHSATTPHPLFNRELYKNRNFVAGLGFMTVLGITNVALAAVLPTMYQTIYHYPVMQSGMLMAPRGIGVMTTMVLANRLLTRLDFRVMISFGYATAALGMFTMTSWSLDMGYDRLILSSFIQGLGLGCVFTPMNMVAFATLKPELRPDGSSLLSLFRNLGGSFGISFIVTMLARNQQTSHADLAAHVTNRVISGVDLGSVVERLPGVGSSALAMIDAEVNRQASMIAYLDNFYFLSWVLLAIAPLPFLLKKPQPGPIFAEALTE